ncbi:MAG: DEAD/DEAH box helicase [Candidatus Marinimicrobia bacterium]|nr:DEAD/DEAH box helicase [Candidatus Neomarinimicrobiota bacterium]
MTFKDLNVIEPILRSLEAEGYTHPTPIQEQSIPILLRGMDLLGSAQTGTGKTAAFAIPILQLLYQKNQSVKRPQKIRALIVTPTRELAIQIGESFSVYGKHTGIRNTVIFGGVKQGKQTKELSKGIDVLVATPGRLLDLIGQGIVSLDNVEYSVLDEADRMLDMGFIHDIRKIIDKLPAKRQSLFFSATMPPDIVALSQKLLRSKPEKVSVTPEQTTAEKVAQSVYFVPKKNKVKLLIHLMKLGSPSSVLVFSRTKHGANKIVRLLDTAGIVAEAIHSNKSQTARQRALGNFKNGETPVLVATDIAARGIDVDDLAYVVNYDLPNVPETYIHRIGRTGRAGLSGMAISFCDPEEEPLLRDIQKLINQKIPRVDDHPYKYENASDSAADSPTQKKTVPSRTIQGPGADQKNGNRKRRFQSRKRYKNGTQDL